MSLDASPLQQRLTSPAALGFLGRAFSDSLLLFEFAVQWLSLVRAASRCGVGFVDRLLLQPFASSCLVATELSLPLCWLLRPLILMLVAFAICRLLRRRTALWCGAPCLDISPLCRASRGTSW